MFRTLLIIQARSQGLSCENASCLQSSFCSERTNANIAGSSFDQELALFKWSVLVAAVQDSLLFSLFDRHVNFVQV